MSTIKTQLQIFVDILFEHVKQPIYFATDINDIAKECFENEYKVGIPQDVLVDMDPMTLSAWLEAVRYGAIDQLNAKHTEPPFIGKLKYVDGDWAVCKALLDGLQKQEYPADNEVIICKRILAKKSVFEFKSYDSWGPIKFGMSNGEVRKVVNLEYSAINTETGKAQKDYFNMSAFMVEYNEQEQVKAIEITSDAQVIWEGMKIIGTSAPKVKEHIESKGYKLHPTKEGSYYKDLGLYFSSNNLIGSLVLFAKGYYDEIEDIL
jgi:hypothetical protein